MKHRSFFVVVVVVLAAAGCPDRALPPDLVVRCGEDADCPASKRCSLALATPVCVDEADFGLVCGDGEVRGDEACDDGADNGDAPGGCRADCTPFRCGDGVVEQEEIGRPGGHARDPGEREVRRDQHVASMARARDLGVTSIARCRRSTAIRGGHMYA